MTNARLVGRHGAHIVRCLVCCPVCPQVSDGLMGGCQGVMRGCGRQVSLMINTIVVSSSSRTLALAVRPLQLGVPVGPILLGHLSSFPPSVNKLLAITAG